MTKPYVEYLIDDTDHLCGYFAKGKFTQEEMAEQIRWQWDEEFQFGEHNSIETRFFRWIPEPSNSDTPFTRRLEKSKPGRGAFVATVIYLI